MVYSLVYSPKEAKDDYGVNAEALEMLTNPSNWTVRKPRINVYSEINQAGNLAVSWMPEDIGPVDTIPDNIEFREDIFLKVKYVFGAYYHQRPINELMWFRKPSATMAPSIDKEIWEAMELIIHGILMRHSELTTQILEVLHTNFIGRPSVKTYGDLDVGINVE